MLDTCNGSMRRVLDPRGRPENQIGTIILPVLIQSDTQAQKVIAIRGEECSTFVFLFVFSLHFLSNKVKI